MAWSIRPNATSKKSNYWKSVIETASKMMHYHFWKIGGAVIKSLCCVLWEVTMLWAISFKILTYL